jgi:hypothetical protein
LTLTSPAATPPAAPIAKAEPAQRAVPPPAPVVPPGPFAALPAQTDSPPVAVAPATPPHTIIRRAKRPHLAALPPHAPLSQPAARELQTITILRGGRSFGVTQGAAQSSSVALAVPPAIRVIRPRRIEPGFAPPGPLILRVQN